MDIFEVLRESTPNKSASQSNSLVQSIVGSTYITIFAINFTTGMLANLYLCFKATQCTRRQKDFIYRKRVYGPFIVLSVLHCMICGVQFFELDSAISSLWGHQSDGCMTIRQLRTVNLVAVPLTIMHASWHLHRVICKQMSLTSDVWPTALTVICTVMGVVSLFVALLFNAELLQMAPIGTETTIYGCSRYRINDIGHIASSIAPFLGYLIVLVVYVWFYAMVSLCTDVSADHIRIAGNFVSKDDQIAPLCSAWKDIAVAYLIFWAPFWLIHHISLFVYLPWPWKVFYSVAKLFSNFTSFVQAMLAIRALSSLGHYSASGLEVGDQERDYPENSALMALASQANAISTWVKTDAMSGGRRTHRSSDDGEFSSSEDQRRKVLASRQLDAIIFGDSFTEEE